MFHGITDRFLSAVKNKPLDFHNLSRLAMDHADAIIVGQPDVDPELVAYAQATGKPLLLNSPELTTDPKILADFYAKLLNPEK